MLDTQKQLIKIYQKAVRKLGWDSHRCRPTFPQILSRKESAAALGALYPQGSAVPRPPPGAIGVTLTHLGVNYQYRRQGIGKELLDFLHQVVDQLG